MLAAGIDLAATEALASRAYDAYQRQHRFDKAARSALVLARLTAEKLRGSVTDLGERQAAFDAAWRCVTKALAACDRFSHPGEFAELNLVAAALLGVRPGSPTFDNASETVAYLDRAIGAYQLSGDVSRCAEAALLVLRQLRSVPAGRSPNNARRAFYLGLVNAAAGDSLELDPEDLLFLAETWAKIWTPEVPRALECAYQLAVQAYAKALDRWAASAKLFTGRLMRDLSGHPDLIAGGLLGGGLNVYRSLRVRGGRIRSRMETRRRVPGRRIVLRCRPQAEYGADAAGLQPRGDAAGGRLEAGARNCGRTRRGS